MSEESIVTVAGTFPDRQLGKITASPMDMPSGPEGQECIVAFTGCGRKFIGLNGGPKFVPNEYGQLCNSYGRPD